MISNQILLADDNCSRSSSKKIVSIQYARAFAAIMVVFGHTASEASKLVPVESGLRELSGIYPFGMGVDIFFITSGFIMVFVSQYKMGTHEFARTFIIDRITRIVPNYWFYTILMIIPLIFLPSVFDTAVLDIRQLVMSLLFIPGIGQEIRPTLKLGWTLNYEMFFYVLFAISLYFGRAKAHLLVFGLICTLAFKGIFAPASWAPLSFWANTIILEFAAGILMGKIFFKGVRIGPLFGTVLFVTGTVMAAIFADYATESTRFIYIGIPALIITMPFILWRNNSINMAIFEKLGDASYTLYLSHPFCITAVYIVWSRLIGSGTLSFVTYIVFTVSVSLVYALLAYRLIEVPITRAARNFKLLNRERIL